MKKYRKLIENKRPALKSDQTNKQLQPDLESNIKVLKELFEDCSDVVITVDADIQRTTTSGNVEKE